MRGYDSRDRDLTNRATDEVRSWFGDEEAAGRRRMDEQYRRQRARQPYEARHEQEWGDYPYRGETWRGGESAGRERYRHPYGGRYGFGWETERPTFRGVGPKGYYRPDARIQEDACDRLTRAPDIDASEIEVRTTDGEVTLSGSVRDRLQKRRAEDLVEGVPGVRDVHNNLHIKRLEETHSLADHASPAPEAFGAVRDILEHSSREPVDREP